MYFNAEDVLRYLSWEGFGVRLPDSGLTFSLIKWHNLRLSDRSSELGIEEGSERGVMVVRPLYKDLTAYYMRKPNFGQIFSRLEITAGDNGSLLIDSPRQIFFGKSITGGYSQIRLLRTVRD